MNWLTEEVIDEAKRVLEQDPQNKRQAIAGHLGVTEYKARQILRAIDSTPEPVNGPTIAVFDLETTDLSADFGRLLCGSILSYPSGEMRTFRYDEYADTPSNDREVAVAVRDYIERHHISCGYYSKGFDIGFLNTRLVVNGERPMRRMLHLDPIWYYRGWRGMKPRSSKMKVVAKVFDLGEEKQDVPDETWIDARHGDKDAMDIIVDRCESDVRITMNALVHCLDNDLIKNVQSYP
jgi:hypothetical protein